MVVAKVENGAKVSKRHSFEICSDPMLREISTQVETWNGAGYL